MFGRIARPPLLRRALGGTCTVGAAAYCYKERESVVPTLEALGRVGRLVGCFVKLVAEYKFPAMVSHNNKHPESSPELEFWHSELAKRQQAFDDAQSIYSKESQHHDIRDRVQAKKHEKTAMEVAANELADAKAQLEAIGTADRTSERHQRGANLLLDLCHQNCGVYIKIGQHLANLDYLLPSEYILTLSKLYDDNPVTDYDAVCQVIQEDLGAHPNVLFDSFEPTPIASASLAQVHVAYRDGQKLAVKVQHRGLRETSRGDIASLVFVVRLAERLFPDFSFGWLADEIAPNLPKELDFQHEGRNAELSKKHFQNSNLRCVVPSILWDQTSERVLTMEFEEGFKASDKKSLQRSGLCKSKVATLISSVFASQIFETGHVHCDPHEANVLLRKSKSGQPEIVLLDHGLYKQLEPDFRRHYAGLWKSLMLADIEGIYDACQGLNIQGTADTHRLFTSVLTARPFDEVVERSKRQKLYHNKRSAADEVVIRGYAQKYLPHIVKLLDLIPREMLLLLKMNDCLRHIDSLLETPPSNSLMVTGQYAVKALYKNEMKETATLLGRWYVWMVHVRITIRIRVHQLALWCVDYLV